MKLDIKWNKTTYNEFLEYLNNLSDLEYKKFSSIINTSDNLIGIRMPILKKIAKEISKYDYYSFIKYNTHKTHEETLIHGLIIGYIKDNFKVKINLLNEFIPYIIGWGICDSTCTNLTTFKSNLEDGFKEINNYLNSSNPWSIRVGLVLLLNFYINDEYIDKIINIVSNVKNDHYYVKMANAWLISFCYIKFPDKTITLFKNKSLDRWTHNKAIQKIRESNRISKTEKEMLKDLKI